MSDYLKPETIRPFLLHEDTLVRGNVATYFRDASSEDEELIPLVVRACKRFGEKDSFAALDAGRHFKQTLKSVGLLLELVEGVQDELTIYALNDVLAAMPAELFSRCQPELRRSVNVYPSTLNVLCQRLGFAGRPAERLWAALEHFTQDVRGGECPDAIHRSYAGNLVDALVPHDEPSAETLIERLTCCSGRKDWGALFIIDLLGKRRIQTAVPALIDCSSYDSILLAEHATEALLRIGCVEAVRLLRARMPHEDEGFRYHATPTLAGFKHSEAEAALIELLACEDNTRLKTRYCEGLCSHYSIKAEAEIRRQIELSGSVDGTVLKAGFLVTSIIRGSDLPDAKTWREEIENPQWDPEEFCFEPVFESSTVWRRA